MNAHDRAVEATVVTEEQGFDFDSFFHLHYGRIARVAARVVSDRARAEEIAVEALWKLWRNPGVLRGEQPWKQACAWVYRTTVRMSLDELRKDARRMRRESLAVTAPRARTPEEAHREGEERDRVRLVLALLEGRQAELLLLRNNGLSYAEVAAALDLNPASVGTLIARAQQTFRKEYTTRYGEPTYER